MVFYGYKLLTVDFDWIPKKLTVIFIGYQRTNSKHSLGTNKYQFSIGYKQIKQFNWVQKTYNLFLIGYKQLTVDFDWVQTTNGGF